MQELEASKVRRAALLLVGVSLLRWGVAQRPPPRGIEGENVLPELVQRTDRAAEEEARRTRPLEPDERIDPNRADAIELDRLPGVGPAIATAIVREREGGGAFRESADLTRVRGIGPALLARIEPSIDLERPPPPGLDARGPGSGGLDRPRPPTRVDLNRADAVTLERLPGIGPVIARRVVSVRAARPFRTVDELVRVPGIGPKTLERLRNLVTVARTP